MVNVSDSILHLYNLGAAASSEYFRGGHQAGQKQDFKDFYFFFCCCHFYRTQVRSLATLVSDSVSDSVTHSGLVDLTDVTLAFE